MISILNKLGFKFKSSVKDDAEKIGYEFYEHSDDDLKCVKVEVNYNDETLSNIQSIDVVVPSFITTNPSTERLEQILALLRPEMGEFVTVFD